MAKRAVTLTPEEEQFIRDNYRTMSDNQIGLQLVLTASQVGAFRRKLGLLREDKQQTEQSKRSLSKEISPDKLCESCHHRESVAQDDFPGKKFCLGCLKMHQDRELNTRASVKPYRGDKKLEDLQRNRQAPGGSWDHKNR